MDTRADLVARINNACVRIKDRRHELRRATLSNLQRVQSALRLVAASLKICYEMSQTSTSQGFCPLQIISNTMVSTCMHVMLVVMLFIK